MLLIKNNLSYHIVFSESVSTGYEILIVDMIYEQTKLRLSLVYRAPSCESLATNQLFKVITDFPTCEFSYIVIGDFNVATINWSMSNNNYANLMHCHGLEQKFF